MAQKTAIDAAIQANKDHQYALKVYIERLENELKTIDKMISAIDSDDDDTEDIPDNGIVYVEGATKPVSVVLPKFLLSEESPFAEDAQWRKRYEEYTTVNQMKTKEHEALREAVRIENMRMLTLNAQSRNQHVDLKAFPPEYFEQNTEGIDWRRVSVKMSSLLPSSSLRTPLECKIRWLGHLHPSINHGSWTPEEIRKLKDIIVEEENRNAPINWTGIAKKLETNRTPLDCMRHGMARRVHTWSPEADRRLLEAVELYGQNNWQLVAMTVSEDATAHQCQKRYLDALDPSLKFGPWTPEEDDQLRRAIAAFTGTPLASISSTENTATAAPTKQTIPWQDVALFVPGRTNNQCREHYQDTILKSTKRKRKVKTNKATSKGKEKVSAVGDADEAEEDSESNATEAVESTEMGNGRREKSVSTTGPRTKKMGGKDRQKADGIRTTVDSEVNAESEETQQPDSPSSRSRPRKKADSIIKQTNVPEYVEPNAHSEASNDAHTPDSEPTKRKGKAAAKRKTSPLVNAEVFDQHIIDGSDYTVDSTAEGQLPVAEPVSKKRKTAGRPKKRGTSSEGTTLHAESHAGSNDSVPSTASEVPPIQGEDTASSGRRRSTRLSSGKA
ncbi:uncharacterized protein FOMMEDRAFT_29808 [Fomitiporia mediterranea MF3/22]|uniref:uncharacterized protein n=1 Tax=Fomitiporia mediterranea (strain MF3/22) TaxID=694068 RepID=UPI0004409A43|nr:uncharacterized protein FOMMEDRAFT_29808 [Fomitiporia mediterranea MF3/22]EJD01024.1 hypothetical protein FOMMEDRAFT_29808 [Fomitiporia mediterranea MF3/22]